MAESDSISIRMILPPDGRQTRIDFFQERASKKAASEWWNSFSSWFRNDKKEPGTDLGFYKQQLTKEGYSEKSCKSYLFMMKRFLEYYNEHVPAEITMGEIEDYNFEFFVSGRYSRSYQLQFISAIKLYFQLTQGIDLNLKHLRKSGTVRKTS